MSDFLSYKLTATYGPYLIFRENSNTLPLHIKKDLPNNVYLGIWKIEEQDDYFASRLELSDAEIQQLTPLKARRRTEWLATRWLVHILSGRSSRGSLIKDEHGKPYLDDSKFQISISHTKGYAAAIAADRLVGIDIQVRVLKISRIAPKFMSELELRNVPAHRYIDYLHIYWGIKESLYKAHGRRALNYRQHLHVHPFNIELQMTSAEIKKGNAEQYGVHFALCSDYVLTYVIEQ